jgi:hypothetical protein
MAHIKGDFQRGFSFKTVKVDGDRPHGVAQFTCALCKDVLNINNTGSKEANWFVIKAVQHGWLADERNRSKTKCPKCQAATTLVQIAKPIVPVIQGITTVKPIDVRDPTIEERVKIRNHLDKSFDDKIGMYLDDMSDQEIGRLTNVPWAIVAKIREAAYGPIRSDPVLVAMDKRIKELTTQIGTLRDEFEVYKRKKANAA